MTIHRELDDGILTVTLDDGDKNLLVPEVFEGLTAALDEPDARAIVLAGREGFLSAGLDLTWLAANGRTGTERILVGLGTCLLRWWTEPRPTVCAATGHAIAAGTMLAMACDHAVAAEGGWWGLLETQIDFELPEFAIALARANVRTDRLEDLLLPGARIDAAAAVEAGFADEVVPPRDVLDRARAHAAELAQLPARAYGGTKRRLRAATAEGLATRLDEDVRGLTSHL